MKSHIGLTFVRGETIADRYEVSDVIGVVEWGSSIPLYREQSSGSSPSRHRVRSSSTIHTCVRGIAQKPSQVHASITPMSCGSSRAVRPRARRSSSWSMSSASRSPITWSRISRFPSSMRCRCSSICSPRSSRCMARVSCTATSRHTTSSSRCSVMAVRASRSSTSGSRASSRTPLALRAKAWCLEPPSTWRLKSSVEIRQRSLQISMPRA